MAVYFLMNLIGRPSRRRRPLSIGLASLGAYGVIFNVGDWGWLIGSGAGALVYSSLFRDVSHAAAVTPGE